MAERKEKVKRLETEMGQLWNVTLTTVKKVHDELEAQLYRIVSEVLPHSIQREVAARSESLALRMAADIEALLDALKRTLLELAPYGIPLVHSLTHTQTHLFSLLSLFRGEVFARDFREALGGKMGAREKVDAAASAPTTHAA